MQKGIDRTKEERGMKAFSNGYTVTQNLAVILILGVLASLTVLRAATTALRTVAAKCNAHLGTHWSLDSQLGRSRQTA